LKLKCDEPLSIVAWAVQVDSIKTRVESAPGVCNQRLKLKCDEPLSNDAFKLNLRRYNVVDYLIGDSPVRGWAVQVDSIKTRVESAYGFSA
jgi:hypothetical protein